MTYSIVARDPSTGEMGIAVQSHWFAAGSTVPFAEAGVGAVATQASVEESYGPRGLDLMRAAAYSSGPVDLSSRLLAALDAAEAEGGDVRGRQAAGILIVGPDRLEEPWR